MPDALPTSVTAGAPFEVRLASTPGTGYQWLLDAAPAGVELVDAGFVPPPDAERVVGGTGTQVFRLKAAQPGHYRLVFVLKRRWEASGVETKVVELEAK